MFSDEILPGVFAPISAELCRYVASSNRDSMVLLRAYSPLGFYPSEALCHAQGVFVLDSDLSFSAVPRSDIDIGGRASETVWVYPAEVRLLSALVLSVPQKHGKVYPYPDYFDVRVELDDDADLTAQETQDHLKEVLIDEISFRKSGHNPLFYRPVPQPPVFDGGNYRINDEAADLDHQRQIFESIDITDSLLVRGLGALLKSDLLSTHHIFHTGACLSLYIAMEASMEIIQRRLSDDMESPSASDASQYLADVFDNDVAPDRYFGEYYDDRIRTVHPNSRFGIFPHAPLAADDFFDLRDQLRSVYDFLVTGRVDPAFQGH